MAASLLDCGNSIDARLAGNPPAVVRLFAPSSAVWNASLALTTTTPVAVQAAAGAGLRRVLTTAQIANGGAAVDLILLDGAVERWRLTIPAGAVLVARFRVELVATANTALNVNLGAAGTVRANFQGYTAP